MTYVCKCPVGALFLSTWCALAGAAEPTNAAAEAGVFEQAWDSVTDIDAWHGEGNWRLAVAPVAPHFRYSAEHRPVWALAVERQRPDDWLAGLSYFSNSFGQPSAYAYIGRRHAGLLGAEPLFFQWSAGLLYGYVGKYKDKVALNVAGFAPGALIGMGWQFDPHFAATVHLLGDAALMLQFSYDLH